MKSATPIASMLLAAALLVPAAASAETRSDVYNGATCIPYPPFNAANAVPYSNWLYGFRGSAFCHFTVPDTWNVSRLARVWFQGQTGPSSVAQVRLCVYSPYSYTATCGAPRSVSGSFYMWANPPSPVPSYAVGAYLSVLFPTDVVTTFNYFIPEWSR